MSGSITEVAGITVGHHHRCDADATVGDPDGTPGTGWACGTTVVLAPLGTVGAVDVRGGAPGTRETELLDPANTVRHVDAVVLTGSLPLHDPRFEQWLAVGGRLFVVAGQGPVMEASRITLAAPGEWLRESLFETVVDPLIHAAEPPKFVF